MNNVVRMYERQKAYLVDLLGTENFEHIRSVLNEKYLLRLHGEATEVFDAAKLKESDPILTPEENEHLLEEIIDCFKYVMNLFIVNGFTAEDIVRKFEEKSDIVDERLRQKKERSA
ncbi:MAG: hypothetical protein WC346_03305 [Methanogenium sp.]